MLTDDVLIPNPPRQLRDVISRRASRRLQGARGCSSAEAAFWIDPTSTSIKHNSDSELSQELLALRQKISNDVTALAEAHPNPKFQDERQKPQQLQQPHQTREAHTALLAFPHLRAVQQYAEDMTILRAYPMSNAQQQPVDKSTSVEVTIDDFWEEVAEATSEERLTILCGLLMPHTMSQFVVATATFFRIRQLLEDEDELYFQSPQSHALVVQLLLALEDVHAQYLPTTLQLLHMFAKYPPLKQLMRKRRTTQLLQARKRAIHDEALAEQLQALSQKLLS